MVKDRILPIFKAILAIIFINVFTQHSYQLFLYIFSQNFYQIF